MYRVPDSPPPPQTTADGNNPNPSSSSAGNGEPSGLSPPAAPLAEVTAAERSPGSSPARPAQPGAQPGGGSSIYDLFLTAVGLTPRGLAAGTFSAGGSAGQADEEDFWSAHEESGEGSAGDGAGDAEYGGSAVTAGSQQPTSAGGGEAAGATVATAGLGAGVGEGHLSETQQFLPTTNGEIVHRTSGAAAGAGVSAPAPQTGVHGRPGEGPTSRARQQLLSDAEIGMRYPGGTTDGQAGSASLEAATAVAGTARRRRRLFGGNTAAAAAAAESGAR